jgi:hypothetical protein
MPTDRFLDELAAGLQPVTPRQPGRELRLLALIALVELALFLLMGAARKDFMLAIRLPALCWKLGSMAVLMAAAAVTAIRSFDPSYSPRSGMSVLRIVAGAALALGWIIDRSYHSDADLWSRLMWREGLDCVMHIVLLSIPAMVTLALLMRRGAPGDGRASALAAGAAGAAWGAFVFAFKCPHDDPLYITVWYAVGCAIVIGAARLVLPLLSRW